MNVDFKTIEELIGRTITKIETSPEEVVIETSDGSRWQMWHSQDCCESVTLDVIDGIPQNLIGSPLVVAKQEFADQPPSPQEYPPESATYTNFTIATAVAEVVFKWVGESNGYYSEEVYFAKID